MTRLPRQVLPGYPYHVTQRGNRRQQTFFEDGDYQLYRDLLDSSDRLPPSLNQLEWAMRFGGLPSRKLQSRTEEVACFSP